MDGYAIPMFYEDYVEYLRGCEGVLRVEPISHAQMGDLVETEESLKTATCGLRMENVGIVTCASRKNLFVMFCTSDFKRPDKITMEMVDDRGVTVGHDVPPGMLAEYKARDDVIWFTDNFVLYPKKIAPYDARMVMRACRMEWDVPEDTVSWTYFPSPETADQINGWFGNSNKRLSTVVVGVDGLVPSDGSLVPVPDMVKVPCTGSRHGEPSSQNTFD